MEVTIKMRALSAEQYAKTGFRREMAARTYPEKVRQLVAMQHRLVPIYSAHGRKIVPWTLDRDEEGL